MAGQLNEHPLAELIREISALGLSGALRLERERAKVAVYFETGELVYVNTNLRAYRLAQCVRRWKVLAEEQLARARSAETDLEFGTALVEMKILNRGSLNTLIEQQVSEVLCHALLWCEGSWSFEPRVRVSEDVHVVLHTPALLLESARRLPPEFASRRFQSNNEGISPVDALPDGIDLLPNEAFVLTRVYGPMKLHELVAVSSLPEAEVLRIAYALALGGFIKRELWPVALTEQDVSKARAILASAKPAAKAKPEVSSPASKQAAPVETVRDEAAEIEELFARLRLSTTYYQMLGLVRPVTDTDVKRAYHSLAKRFHPDRFRKSVESELHARIEAAFVKIAEAYEALKNKQLRAVYDSKLLTRPEPAPPSSTPEDFSSPSSEASTPKEETKPRDRTPRRDDDPPPRSADAQFQQGMLELEGGSLTAAISCLGEAARLEPSKAQYRAFYGRALAREARLQRSAEAELKAAVALDANNPKYRVMLAGFYIDIGHFRRAEAELRRALAMDPKNAEARTLMAKVG